MIEMRDVVKRYVLGGEEIYALDHVSLRVNRGNTWPSSAPRAAAKAR